MYSKFIFPVINIIKVYCQIMINQLILPPSLSTCHFFAFCYMCVSAIYFERKLNNNVILMLVISKVFFFHIQYDQISLYILNIIFIFKDVPGYSYVKLGIPPGVPCFFISICLIYIRSILSICIFCQNQLFLGYYK